jgi:hypothetical protein
MQFRSDQLNEAGRNFLRNTGLVLVFTLLHSGLGLAWADELDSWIWRSPRPHNQQAFALIRGGGLWLSLGHNGSVATSIDGMDWDLANLDINSPVIAGAFGNGVFIASAPSRGLYVSTDAHNWNRAPTNPAVSSVVFGAGRFVGVSGSGAIWTSSNGVNWTSQQLSFTHSLSRIFQANGLFFALGIVSADRNEYFMSSDGANWSNAFSLGTNAIDKVIHGNGIYLGLRTIIGATATRSEFRVSADGMSWNDPTVFAEYQIEDVVFANGQFFAVEIYGRILTSTNGTNWIEHPAPALLAATELAWADGVFVSAGVLGSLVSSTDGLNWTRRSVGPQDSLVAISRLNDLLVAVGGTLGDEGLNLSRSTVATSTNGKDWAEHDSATTNSLAAVAFANGRFVAVGAAGTIITSSDAVGWTALSALTTNTLNGVAHGNGRFVAVGGNGTSATILDSPDGVNWSVQAAAANFPTLYAVTFAQNQFVAVGRTNASRQGTLLTSPDGLAWTPRTPTTTNNLRAIAYGNDAFVATGDRGAIVRSTAGTGWTDLSRATIRSLRGVAHGNGWWVIVANPPGQYTSPDGVNWTFRGSLALTTINSIHGVTFGGDSFFVTGAWGQILESLRFNPPAQDTRLRLHYSSAPILTLTGPECRQYDIQSSGTLPNVNDAPDSGGLWQTLTTVSNRIGTVFLPVGTGPNSAARFYRAVLWP